MGRQAQADAVMLPAGPEATTRRGSATQRTTRCLTVVAIGATLAYLSWRATSTVNWGVWWVSVPLLVLEVHAAISLLLFAFSTWDTTAVVAPSTTEIPPGRVAVLIPTYNESVEVLLPTIAAAVALEPAHETWVLDDGDRATIEALAESLGAHYLTRPTHEHAKAGNLNHALAVVDADFVTVLDADHVALPGLLRNTLPYFADPGVAVVQTPQDFYNVGSFEHERRRQWATGRHTRVFNEQGLFYRVIQPGKNRWRAAFWCGTNAVVRTAALRDVGGVATDTVTEDIHTTIRLHRRGWRTIYHNEVLARGLAAADSEQYGAQRTRWGTGAMQVLRSENPLVVPGLTIAQRLAYASTLLGWFDSWRDLGYLLVPPVVLFTGAVPIKAARNTFLFAFALTFIVQRLALQRLGRGRAPAVLSTVFELVRMEPNFKATLTLFTRRDASFRVTAKGRVGDERRRAPVPVLLEAVLVLSAAAAVWFCASAAGLTPLRYGVPWAAYGAAAWLLVNAALVATAALRIRDTRFAAERRGAVRFDVNRLGCFDGADVIVRDVSLGGAHVVAPSDALPAVLTEGVLEVALGASALRMRCAVRSRRSAGAYENVGLEFVPGQDLARAHLALALFHTAAPTIVEDLTADQAELAPEAAPAA